MKQSEQMKLYKRVIDLAKQDLTRNEIAKKLGISYGKVNSMITRMRKHNVAIETKTTYGIHINWEEIKKYHDKSNR